MKLEEIQRRRRLHQDVVNDILLQTSVKNTPIVSFKASYTENPYSPPLINDAPQRLLVWYSGPTTRVVRRAFADAGFVPAPKESNDWHVCWGSPKGVSFYSTLAPGQYCNQIPGSNSMGRKDTLATYIASAKLRFPSEFDIIPKTFVIPEDIALLDAEFERNPDEIYIYKPAMGARGNGIELVTGSMKIPNRETAAVVQEYLKNPLILKGYKFDFRVYACVTSIDPLIVYVYENGLGRFATSKYCEPKIENLAEKTMHLTNFSVNSKSGNFKDNKPVADNNQGQQAAAVNNEDSEVIDLGDNFPSKWMLPDLLNFLQNNKDLLPEKFQDLDVKELILKQIHDLVQKTFICCESRLFAFAHQAGTAHSYPRRNFGVYGFDMILDDDLKLLLIEVNSSPATGTSTELDVMLKFPLLSDLLHLIGMEVGFEDDQIKVPKRFYSEDKKELYKQLNQRTLKSEFCGENEVQKFSFSTAAQLDGIDWRKLTSLEKNCLMQLIDEETRLGEWTRVLPNQFDDYLKLFENQRYLNCLCQKFLKDGVDKNLLGYE